MKFILNNWKTSLLGLIILIALALWILKYILTDDFIKVMGFLSSIGFFTMQDPVIKKEEK